jgi:hypothetical protein
VFVACCAVASGLPRAWGDTPPPDGAAPQPAPAPVPAAPVSSAKTPAPPAPERGPFVGLWVVPWASQQFLGAGADGGYHARWIAGRYRVGILQNGYAPVSGAPLLTFERTQRFFLELEADARWRINKVSTLALGGGVAILSDSVDTTSMNGLAWTTTTDIRWRVRPLLSLMVAGPVFFTNATVYLESNPEGIFALGVSWGRR